MNNLQILDVSLRDGGHRTNFHFSAAQLENILIPLDESGIDCIEVGYRNGSLHPIANLGIAGFCDKEYLLYCKSLIKKSKMAVMAHPGNLCEDDMVQLQECGVQLLRVCVGKGGLDKARASIEFAKKIQLAVSVNFIHLSYYTAQELDAVIADVDQYQPDMIYLADSNGSLLPQQIKTIYDSCLACYATAFGFHAHDNLGLAQANVIAAMAAGVRLIDASLAGMGKGIGNLKTEFFTAYLQAIDIKKYHLQSVLEAANYVRDALKIGQEPIEMDEFTRGISDFSTADLKSFKQQSVLC